MQYAPVCIAQKVFILHTFHLTIVITVYQLGKSVDRHPKAFSPQALCTLGFQYITESSSLYNSLQAYVACEAQFSKTKSGSCKGKGLGEGLEQGLRQVLCTYVYLYMCSSSSIVHADSFGMAGGNPPFEK